MITFLQENGAMMDVQFLLEDSYVFGAYLGEHMDYFGVGYGDAPISTDFLSYIQDNHQSFFDYYASGSAHYNAPIRGVPEAGYIEDRFFRLGRVYANGYEEFPEDRARREAIAEFFDRNSGTITATILLGIVISASEGLREMQECADVLPNVDDWGC